MLSLARSLTIFTAFIFMLASTNLVAEHSYLSIAPLSVENDNDFTLSTEAILPIPQQVDTDPAKVALGLRLFEDKGLSIDGSMSCRTCHLLNRGGGDDEILSPAINGKKRPTNTPTIFNVGLYTLYGWLGTPNTLEGLSEGILKSKIGLANDWPKVLPYLKADASYVRQFETIYDDGVKKENVKDAMAEYMRSLITPNSRFDKYLLGDKKALSNEELGGYQLFTNYGCASCHQGITLGGNMYASSNLFRESMVERGEVVKQDIGRFKKTRNELDRYVFRVPSLRNIAVTGPYFHDGSVATLDESVDLMGRYMLGRIIPKDQRILIVQFLHTLTGEYKGKPLL